MTAICDVRGDNVQAPTDTDMTELGNADMCSTDNYNIVPSLYRDTVQKARASRNRKCSILIPIYPAALVFVAQVCKARILSARPK